MSQISPAGSFGSLNWLQGLGSTANSSASNGVNAGSGATITEESFAIVDINFSGPSLSAASPTSSSPNASSGTSTPDTSTSGASSSGSDLFTNLLNQIQTALQDVLQALGGNTTGAPTTSGSTGTVSTDTTGTGATGSAATGTGSTPSSGSSITTSPDTTQSSTASSDATAAANTQENSISPSDFTITAISIESVDVTTSEANPGTTTPTDSNSTGATTSSNNDLQLLQQVFASLSNVFQQNGLGSSQTSSAAESPLTAFLGQNGLTPDQFSQGLFSSLQQNGGTGFSLAQIFQNTPSGQNLNLLA